MRVTSEPYLIEVAGAATIKNVAGSALELRRARFSSAVQTLAVGDTATVTADTWVVSTGAFTDVATEDAASASLVGSTSSNGLGSSSNPVTDPAAARPTGLTVVYWLTATQPTNLAVGDVWETTA